MRMLQFGIFLGVVASFQPSHCWLIDTLMSTFRSLTFGAEKTVQSVAEPFIRTGNMAFSSGHDILETVEEIPIVGDVAVGVQNMVNVGRSVLTPGINAALEILEQTCAPLQALTAAYLSINADSNEVENLRISLVTPSGKEFFTIANAPKAIIGSRYYDPSLKTVLYIHGYTEDPSLWSFSRISAAFQQIGGYNILALDSSALVRLFYTRATVTVKYIGRRLAQMIANLVIDGVSPEDILLVAHSLGGHIAGYTGRSFYKITGTKLSRISLLDPAGPCFAGRLADNDLHMSNQIAEFVDVMHTNAGVAGLSRAFGHVDFYVNGGSVQIGCSDVVCDHIRAVEYYTESILNPDAFIAVECDSWQHFLRGQCDGENITRMGFPVDRNSSGIYFIKTFRRKPYGLGFMGIK